METQSVICTLVHADGFLCCREGSVAAHLWLVMSVPSSHVGTVTVEKVSMILQKGLGRYSGSNNQMASLPGYIFNLPSLSVTGESKTGNLYYVFTQQKVFVF